MASKKWSNMTTQLWRNPEVASLNLEARGLFMELVVWQLEHGHIPDDELYFERLYGRLCKDFHGAWSAVTAVLARTNKGFVSPFVAQAMAVEQSDREGAKKRQARKRSSEVREVSGTSCHAVSRVTSRDLPPPSPSPLLSPTPPINSSLPSPSPSSPEGVEPKVSTTPQKEFLDWWRAEWKRSRNTEYLIQAKDAICVAKLLKTETVDEMRKRAAALLSTQDAWLARSASLTMLLGQWNQLAGKSPQNAAQRVTVGQPPRTPDDDLRAEWFKWHSRVNGVVPAWPGAAEAVLEIERLRGARR